MKKLKIVLLWSIVFIIMALIFILSNDNGTASSAKSNFVVKIVKPFVYPFIDKEYLANNRAYVDSKISFAVRKTAHFTIYAILGIALFMAFKYTFNFEVALFAVIPIAFIYAMFDEYHQTFVNGRSGNFTDVLIDTSGVLCVYFIIVFIYLINKKKKLR